MSENEASSERIFLIYGPGYPETGQNLTEDALQTELAEGRLTSEDLVWCGGVWRRLADIFELPAMEQADYSDGNEPEIALSFRQLPPCRGVVPQADEDSGRKGKGGLFRHVLIGKDGKRRPAWQLILLAGIIVILVVLLVLYVIIPSVNKFLGRPAYVLLVNPYESDAVVCFLGKDYTLKARDSLTVPDIYGRMPRSERLTLAPKGGGTPPLKVSVKLRAGQTVLVNPAGIMTFGVMSDSAGGHGITESENNAILQEIQGNIAPGSALKAAEHCCRDGSQALLAFTDDTLVYSTDAVVTEGGLDFTQLGLKRSDEYRAKHGSEEQPVKKGVTRTLLRGVELTNAKVYYRRGARDVAECEFPVTFRKGGEFAPVRRFGKNIPEALREFEALEGDGTCRVRFDETQTSVTIQLKRADFRVRRNQRILLGSWNYVAEMSKDGKWNWRWRYTGKDAINVATLKLDMDKKGDVSVQYEEHRGKSN